MLSPGRGLNQKIKLILKGPWNYKLEQWHPIAADWEPSIVSTSSTVVRDYSFYHYTVVMHYRLWWTSSPEWQICKTRSDMKGRCGHVNLNHIPTFSCIFFLIPNVLCNRPDAFDFSYVVHFSQITAFCVYEEVQFSCSVVSDSLQPRGLQHARLPCPSPTPGACSNSCSSSHWCHPTIPFPVIRFSSCLQSFPASESFPMSQFFSSGGQSIGASVWGRKEINIQIPIRAWQAGRQAGRKEGSR